MPVPSFVKTKLTSLETCCHPRENGGPQRHNLSVFIRSIRLIRVLFLTKGDRWSPVQRSFWLCTKKNEDFWPKKACFEK